MPQISDLHSAKLTFGKIYGQLSSTQSHEELTGSSQVFFASVTEDNHIINICFTILKICDDFLDKELESNK